MNQDDKQFMTQFVIVLGALVVFTVVIFVIARVVMSYNSTDYGPLIEKQVEERTAPVGEAYSGEVPKAAKTAAAGGASGGGGEQTYTQVCAACHDSGASGAPKLTDKAAWQPRIEQGKQMLYDHAINGFNAMPAKGGDPSLSDEDVQAAVDHILDTVSGSAAGGEQTAKAPSKGSKAGGASPAGGQAKSAQADAAPKKPTDAAGAGITQAAKQGASPENKSIYQAMCSSCHDSGALGAPKVTDKAMWQARTAKGAQALYASAINGIGAMPAKGGHSQLSEDDVKMAVNYMIAQVSDAKAAGASDGAKQPAAKTEAAPGQQKSSKMGTAESAKQSRPGDAQQDKSAGAKSAAKGGGQSDQPKKAQGKTNAAGGNALAAGKKTYESVCSTCHDTGMAGAPKFGDKAAWASHLKEGKAHLYESAINGKGAMPAKGGNPQLSEQDVKAAVDYMLNAVQ